MCAWSDLKGNAPTTTLTQEIAHQILWNNRFIRIEKRSICRSNILKAGFLTVADLYDKHGNSKTAKYPCVSRLSPVENYFIMCLFNAVPQEWRKKLGKSFRKDLPALKFDQNYFYLEIEKEKVDISKVKSRYIYKKLLSKKATKPTAVSRYEKLYNTETFKLDWKKIFLIPYKTTLYTKLREFQFKILNKILYANDLSYKIGKVKSPLCDFCQTDSETTENLLFHCHFVKRFWNEMYVLLKAKNILSKPLKIEEVIFGMCEDKPNVLLANLIILNGKYYTYYSKLNNSPLSCKSFIQRTKTIYYTESIIAKENKVSIPQQKMGKIYPFCTGCLADT